MKLGSADVDNDKLVRLVEQMRVPLQVAIEREMIYRHMDEEREKIYQRSIHDPLTGLFTRLYMNDVVQKMFHQQDRNESISISALILDLDHFKRINDTYGHGQGDVVLKRLGQCILENCRKADIPVRFGGEEFIIFTQAKKLEHIGIFAEHLRKRIESLEWTDPMSTERVTASIGIGVRSPGETLVEFMARIDTALYEAKENGRNRVCSSSIELDETPVPQP